MRRWSALFAVLMAQGFLEFFDDLGPLGPRLALPKHYETQSAHAAMGLGITIRTPAEHLHVTGLRVRETLDHENHNSPVKTTLPIPLKAIRAVFRATRG